MGRNRENAHIRKWRGQPYLIYTDYSEGKPQEKRQSLAKYPKSEYARLIEDARIKEREELVEFVRTGTGSKHKTPLIETLKEFLEFIDRRKLTREENPEARAGISAKTHELLSRSVNMFIDWLAARKRQALTTGELDANTLTEFFDHVATQTTKLGNKAIRRRAATINQYRRNLRTALRWANNLRPRRFHDFDALNDAFRPTRADADPPHAFSPETLRGFLKVALEREDPNRVVTIVRLKGRKQERFQQTAPADAATPVSRLFLLVTLTGCRVGEALGLKWNDVDLNRGRLTIRAQKTGRTRVFPLVGALEGEVAPTFLQLLRQWRLQAGEREYVLPHTGLAAPFFPKSGWHLTNLANEGPRVGPQTLRQNFTSYAASLGIPATVAALWQGHGAAVAEKHYRAQVLDRQPGKTFEEAMGLKDAIERMLSGQTLHHRSDMEAVS